MVVGAPQAYHQLATMGRQWSVIIQAIAHALQRPGATHDRDSLCHRSIAVIVPSLKDRHERLTPENAGSV